ncbi:MAG: hypothetical protein MUP90_03660 [Gammaproteobacteria bacterium]|nr:hypothetical protein [Gammaproteobacteria bacterium]
MTQVIPSKEQGNLNQVWAQLSHEYQAGVIHLMAQLVLKRIVAQLGSSRKEACDVQNPG